MKTFEDFENAVIAITGDERYDLACGGGALNDFYEDPARWTQAETVKKAADAAGFIVVQRDT